MHVSELYVYPLKSARGIALDQARLAERGIEHDRRWMLVDAGNVFISQREVHRLALVDVALADHRLVVSAPGMQRLEIAAPENGAPIQTRIWNDQVPALLADAAAHEWFSTFLQTECRLVYMPDDARRIVDRTYVPDERIVGFADAFPLLITTQASLDELNERLARRGEAPVPMKRFRPNVVIAGSRPSEEDEWRSIRIGDVPVDVVKPCARCVITTVDPATAEAGKEPLRTLATYRKRGSKVLFGQNAVHRALGTIRRGDAVTATARKD